MNKYLSAEELSSLGLKTDPEFNAWVDSLSDKHWSKYDLSACRLGWIAAKHSTWKLLSEEKPVAMTIIVAYFSEEVGEWVSDIFAAWAIPEHFTHWTEIPSLEGVPIVERRTGWQVAVDCVSCHQRKDYLQPLPPSFPPDTRLVIGRCEECAKRMGEITPTLPMEKK